jgi:hypothetical protein
MFILLGARRELEILRWINVDTLIKKNLAEFSYVFSNGRDRVQSYIRGELGSIWGSAEMLNHAASYPV